ncbi:Gfo/Idh/MocA family oxidoreductase [Halonotius sp. F2-221B]|uniref:aldo/keto reductase n=1 Tax=Halonotius sp. F2-221B TaxID=2731620 RepID=UPI00398BA763
MHCLFVGAGSIASSYAADLAESELTLAGVCDLDSDRAETLAASHDCPAFDDLDAALDAVDAPLVVNLTSHAAHAEVTRTALAADRHVYSEKPLALDSETAGELVEMARKRNLALGCAPASVAGPTQQRARRLLGEGRLGPVQLAYAHAHVGRVTDWHDRPDSFLSIGPLYDGGVYPLSLLVAWFGPVERVRVANSLDPWPEREPKQPEADSHVEATLAFRAGPTVRLTASFYAPHRSREFYGLELHGDDGSLYLDNTGRMEPDDDALQYGGLGRSYTTVPPQSPADARAYIDAVDDLAASVAAGEPDRRTARRGAHVVAVCNAIETAAAEGGPVDVSSHGVTVPDETGSTPASAATASDDHPLSLPPIGFGCSRYRGDEYVDRKASIATALDAGYRLLDSAELYGNEFRIGDLLDAPGSPDRDHLTILGKVWRTNHQREHLLAACEGSLDELGIDAFDCYMLHWPEAWAHQGSLDRLAEKPVETQEALTFPTDADGEIETASIPLAEAWANLEQVVDRGWADSLGVCNVSRSQLATILDAASIPPAVVQIERHPYQPRSELIEFCHNHDIAVVAHSPLSAPGLLDEPVLAEIGEKYDRSPAGVVLAWNATRGVVPIPSSTTTDHIIDNAAAVATRLDERDCERIDALEAPDFSR